MKRSTQFRPVIVIGAIFGLLAGLLAATVRPPASAQADAEPRLPIDLYLLIDDSSCMAGATFNNMSVDATIAAGVDRVLDQLDPERDRVALIGFGDTAELFVPLTSDWSRLRAGLEELTHRDGSARLDLGYHKIAAELRDGDLRNGALLTTLVLTDGPMMQAPDLARARAQALRTEFGARHFAIAVGTIAQYALLRQISEPGGFWVLEFGGDLISAFEEAGAAIVALAEEMAIATPTPAVPPTATPLPVTPRGYLPVLRRE